MILIELFTSFRGLDFAIFWRKPRPYSHKVALCRMHTIAFLWFELAWTE